MKIREMLDTLQLNKILDKGGETHHQLFTPGGSTSRRSGRRLC